MKKTRERKCSVPANAHEPPSGSGGPNIVSFPMFAGIHYDVSEAAAPLWQNDAT
jgi:hypothetical protein